LIRVALEPRLYGDHGIIQIMKYSRESRLQLLLNTLVPLLVSGGGTALLVLFREDLPTWFYITFLIVIWLVFIVMLVRLALGDLIEGVRASIKRRSAARERRKLVKNWCAKWIDMALLINETIHTEEVLIERLNERYRELHFWFINNRTQVISLWKAFWCSRTPQAYESYSSAGIENHVFYDNWEDPFSCFYEPMSLRMLKEEIESNYWSEGDVRLALNKLAELTNEFVRWVA